MRKLPIRRPLRGRWLAGTLAACAATALLSASAGLAQDSPTPEELEKPPPLPPEDVPIPPKVPGEEVEPTVTIREEDERRIEEYSINGRIYMVKVTPKGGLPYYYIDTDGDGQLELDMTRQPMEPVQPVYWKVKEWK
jgi:hypothetical protein